jgi:hypothetical protein
MTACLFVGPTLRRTEINALAPEVVCLPPVTQGDLYRIAERRPTAIGIVDGYFGGAPSVWHKEILWALSQGIPVFGSASMGALRAAELHLYGMQGVGRIFEAFRDGELQDDDEVAVVHGPAETSFAVASVPMVNIRATLWRGQTLAVVSEASRRRLETIAKSLFFSHRAWPAILQAAEIQGLDGDELLTLRDWLPEGFVDQKRDDALEMLAAMQQVEAGGEPREPQFRFEWTHLWDEMVGRMSAGETVESGHRDFAEHLIEELRLEGPAAYATVKSNALLRMLAHRDAARRGSQASPEAMRAALNGMRERLQLFSRDRLQAWMARNLLDEASLQRLIAQEAELQSLSAGASQSIGPFLLDELRLSGVYERLANRARHKADALRHLRADDSDVPLVFGPDAMRLRMWFFEHRLGLPMPDDPENFAHGLGLASAAEFDRALWREWMYSRQDGRPEPASTDDEAG